MDIAEIARLIRIVDYVLIALAVIFRAAMHWTPDSRLASAIHILVSAVMLVFVNAILFGQAWVLLYVVTPLLTLLAIASLVYVIVRLRR